LNKNFTLGASSTYIMDLNGLTNEALFESICPPYLKNSIIEFIKPSENPYRSEAFTIRNRGHQILYAYLRAYEWQLHSDEENCKTLVIANIRIAKKYRNKGLFKRLLSFLELNNPYEVLIVECVDNEILENYLISKGYQRTTAPDQRINYYKETKVAA
jgi:hypothetical protein